MFHTSNLLSTLTKLNRNRLLHSTSKWESVIGLEVHTQIQSNSKLFSAAGTDFACAVNENVALFDAAIPGTLPVLNRRCVSAGVATALALSCHLNVVSYFDRKHYFYADLPSGYQITQQRLPLATSGHLKFPVYTPGVHEKPYMKSVKIKQLQLEQDSGKSIHDEDNSYSLVDLNRAGIPLMEIVFEPELSDGEEAAALIKELTLILLRLGTCSCKMEEGALRVDANISINRPGEPLGVRSEVKNIGSIRGVSAAVKYEIARQTAILESGGTVINETRSWDAQNKKTIAMRDKETVQDYRYMPEPNLPPLHLNIGLYSDNKDCVNMFDIKQNLPELPETTRTRLSDQYKMSTRDAIVLVNDNELLEYFNQITKDKNIDTKITVNILTNELLTLANKYKVTLNGLKITFENIRDVIELLQSKTINLITARKVLEEIINGNSKTPSEIVNINSWTQIHDKSRIEDLCRRILESNPKIVKQYLNGKIKVFGALMGLVAKETKGTANMAEVDGVLKQLLDEIKRKK